MILCFFLIKTCVNFLDLLEIKQAKENLFEEKNS